MPLHRLHRIVLRLVLAAFVLFATGCGEDEKSNPDADTDAPVGDGSGDTPTDVPGDADTDDMDANVDVPADTPTDAVDIPSDMPPTGVCAGQGPPSGDGAVTGEFRRWQTVSIALQGPMASESDTGPNPFLDMRLNVTFSGPGGAQLVVPGFFDGDGRGNGTGNIWRVRFTPDVAGPWTWQASFRQGDAVAVDLSPTAGTPGGLDGNSGAFCIDNEDVGAAGFHGIGFIEYTGEHYLHTSNGDVWIKGGADSPENFMGYAGFDDTWDLPGGAGTSGLMDGIHRYAPHVADWQNGDPDWNSGAGQGIIGALNYLASESVNSIYFLPCNLGGDGRETWPYLASGGNAPGDLLHFDISKLNQWEMVFAHAIQNGIALHVVLHETEAGSENLHDNGTLGVERMLYYRELAARMGHHPALFWNLGEESDYSDALQIEFATYLDAVDAYDHPTTVHTNINRVAEQYDGLKGNPHFDITSIQTAPNRAAEFVETWRTESDTAGRKWAVMIDEISPAGTGVSDSNQAEIRRVVLWPSLLSGAGGVEWYFGYHDLPLGGDMRTEDFRTRADMWRFTRYALTFMRDLPVGEMAPDDDLLDNAQGEVFGKAGEVYAVYLPNGDADAELDVTGMGMVELRWFDPSTGDFGTPTMVSATGPVALGAPPSRAGEDWVVVVRGDVAPP